jgi:5,6-dimethylbenzimidazole synthase
MRHFLPDPIDPDTLQQLLEAAHAAPSVGYMQPWRFIRITEPIVRKSIHQLVDQERLETARAPGEKEQDFMRLADAIEQALDIDRILQSVSVV